VQTLKNKKPRLVIFDVEGVLIPKNRFFFEVGKKLGFSHLIKILFFGFLYQIGAIPLKSALKSMFFNLRDSDVSTLQQVAQKIPLMPYAKELFDQLKMEGCKTALISSGLPNSVVNNLANEVGADRGFGFEVGLNNEKLTGEIWGDVTEANGKFRVLSQIVSSEGLEFGDCAVVADDRNNASIFLPETHNIGYNPDFLLRMKADDVVTGNLSKILPIIKGNQKERHLPMKNDFVREAIHASGFTVPILVGIFGLPIVVSFIGGVIALYVMSELLRLDGKNLPVVSAITRRAASQIEMNDFAAAPLYFAIGILATLLIFPAPASSAAIGIFAFGDSAASIFGGIISKTPLPLNKSKSVEGSLAGFFFAFLAGSFYISPLFALIGAVVAMFVEWLPLPVNDNILIPLFTGLALWAIL
jgi:HAD superfamily phosphoserine phosphatase-like hydrolase